MTARDADLQAALGKLREGIAAVADAISLLAEAPSRPPLSVVPPVGETNDSATRPARRRTDPDSPGHDAGKPCRKFNVGTQRDDAVSAADQREEH